MLSFTNLIKFPYFADTTESLIPLKEKIGDEDRGYREEGDNKTQVRTPFLTTSCQLHFLTNSSVTESLISSFFLCSVFLLSCHWYPVLVKLGVLIPSSNHFTDTFMNHLVKDKMFYSQKTSHTSLLSYFNMFVSQNIQHLATTTEKNYRAYTFH
jgi:hypothetical protein